MDCPRTHHLSSPSVPQMVVGRSVTRHWGYDRYRCCWGGPFILYTHYTNSSPFRAPPPSPLHNNPHHRPPPLPSKTQTVTTHKSLAATADTTDPPPSRATPSAIPPALLHTPTRHSRTARCSWLHLPTAKALPTPTPPIHPHRLTMDRVSRVPWTLADHSISLLHSFGLIWQWM